MPWVSLKATVVVQVGVGSCMAGVVRLGLEVGSCMAGVVQLELEVGSRMAGVVQVGVGDRSSRLNRSSSYVQISLLMLRRYLPLQP